MSELINVFIKLTVEIIDLNEVVTTVSLPEIDLILASLITSLLMKPLDLIEH